MLCFDHEDIVFFGTEITQNSSRLEINILSCNNRLTHLGGVDDRIPEDCVANLDEQIEYLGPLNLIIYYNQQSFMED